jgi:hypothetical protein
MQLLIKSVAGEPLPAGIAPAPFIVGLGRSGTTLLRLMLDAHPALAIPPETQFIPAVAKACQMAPDPRQAFLQALTAAFTWTDFHLAVEQLQSRIADSDPFDLTAALRAFYTLYAERFGKQRWGDKSGYLWGMVLIQKLIPEARFIHLIRDGRDVALSIKDLWWGPNSIEEAAEHWQAGIQKARRQSADLRFYMEVRYEDLLLDPERQLRQICDFVELDWHPAMLGYYRNAENRLAEFTAILDPSAHRITTAEERRHIHAHVSQPPQTSLIGKWQRALSATQKQNFARIAGAMLREFGYDLETQ